MRLSPIVGAFVLTLTSCEEVDDVLDTLTDHALLEIDLSSGEPVLHEATYLGSFTQDFIAVGPGFVAVGPALQTERIHRWEATTGSWIEGPAMPFGAYDRFVVSDRTACATVPGSIHCYDAVANEWTINLDRFSEGPATGWKDRVVIFQNSEMLVLDAAASSTPEVVEVPCPAVTAGAIDETLYMLTPCGTYRLDGEGEFVLAGELDLLGAKFLDHHQDMRRAGDQLCLFASESVEFHCFDPETGELTPRTPPPEAALEELRARGFGDVSVVGTPQGLFLGMSVPGEGGPSILRYDSEEDVWTKVFYFKDAGLQSLAYADGKLFGLVTHVATN